MPILPNEKKALDALRSELLQNYALLDLKLYGSKAKGTDVEDSDLDVMIVLEDNRPVVESQIDGLIFEINLKYDCLITPIYFGREELETGPLAESPLYKKAVQEGIPL